MSHDLAVVGNNAEANAFVSALWPEVEAAIGRVRGDQCVFVSREAIVIESRRRTYRWLRRELPDVDWRQLRRPAPAGAVLLVIVREAEIGTALARLILPMVGAA
jgi:hypothetical protein